MEEPYWTMGEEKSPAGDSSGGTLSLTSFAFREASQPVSLSPAPPLPTYKTTHPTCSPLIEPQSGQRLSMENRNSAASLHRRLLLLLLLLLPPPYTHQGRALRHTVPNQVQNRMEFPVPVCLNELCFSSAFSPPLLF